MGIENFVYRKAFGLRTLKDGNQQAMDLDTLFWLGSCTKLMTAIAALQCVERGMLSLDKDVTDVLPELKDIEVRTPSKDEEGAFTLTKANNAITLRWVYLTQLALLMLTMCLKPPSDSYVWSLIHKLWET